MTSIHTDIYNAVMSGVNSAVTGIPVDWENINYGPDFSSPFCKVDLLPHSAEPASIGLLGLNEHRGTILLTLHYPRGTGPSAPLAKLDAIAGSLHRGVTLSSGTAEVRLESTWRLPPAYDKAWAKFPLQIRWRCHAGN